MTTVINGSSPSITFSDSTTQTTAFTTTPTINTITSAASTALTIQSAGTTAITVDTSQNVGIGVVPSAWGSVYSKAIQISTQGAYIAGNTSTYSGGTYAWFGNNGYLDSSAVFRYTASTSACQYSQIANQHIWSYAASGTAGNAITFSEAMRIDSSGNLLVGTTTAYAPLSVRSANGGNGISTRNDSGTGAYNAVVFTNNGQSSVVGTIYVAGSTVTYNTSSDYRLKNDVAPIQNALATVESLNPVSFTWVDGRPDDGFLAHEIQAIIPNCVIGEKDAVNEDGTPKYQQMDNSGVIPFLVKAIQEQQALITDLTARLTALEAK